jgi:hypothetical protein
MADPSFGSAGDTIRYSVDPGSAQGPFQAQAELWFQPIAFRWAMNLKSYDAMETQRFVGYYEAAAASSAIVLVRTAAATN